MGELAKTFTPRRLPVISKWQIEDLLNKRPLVSFDLEISTTQVSYSGGRASFSFGEGYEISLDELPEGAECEVYAYIDGRWIELALAAGHFYKLCVFKRGWAPTLMIDGITMHSVLEDPLQLTRKKVAYVEGDVLDCCTGLGYTAIEASRRAKRVVTVEADPYVLELASYNPYSAGLASVKIDVVVQDITSFIKAVRSSAFSYVVHDPPRLSYATQHLYSEALYAEYFRALKRRGGLFHYTGATGSKYRGLDVARGVAERLRRVGFRVGKIERGFGVFATK